MIIKCGSFAIPPFTAGVLSSAPRRSGGSSGIPRPPSAHLTSGIARSASRLMLVLLSPGPMKRARPRLGSYSRHGPRAEKTSEERNQTAAGVTIIASRRDNLEHKSNRKLALVHGRVDNPLCNLSRWFLKARRHRTTTNPSRRPTTCCPDGYSYYPSS